MIKGNFLFGPLIIVALLINCVVAITGMTAARGDTSACSVATRAQTMLFADWNPTDKWGNITNQNSAIDQMAASIKSLGSARIFLNLWHEPENDVSPGGDANCPTINYKGSAGTVADYRNMWRYTESRFTADGVNNVVWVMDYQNY